MLFSPLNRTFNSIGIVSNGGGIAYSSARSVADRLA